MDALRDIDTGLGLYIVELMVSDNFRSDELDQYILEFAVTILVNQLDGFRDHLANYRAVQGVKSCERTGGNL